jgi:hypothetical protein
MEYIDDTKIVMASGNTVKILDINTLQYSTPWCVKLVL